MDDLVSRQGMCDSLDKYRVEKMLEGKDVSLVWECIDKVLQEPSVQPERKTGRWIDESVVTGTTSGATTIIRQYRCSVCGGLFGRQTDNYCYNCGAKMENVVENGKN